MVSKESSSKQENGKNQKGSGLVAFLSSLVIKTNTEKNYRYRGTVRVGCSALLLQRVDTCLLYVASELHKEARSAEARPCSVARLDGR